MATLYDIKGAGLGLKREIMSALQAADPKVCSHLGFLEIAPENWIGVGGRLAKQLDWFAERYPIVAHGLSLSLGGPHPLNEVFLRQVKTFLAQRAIPLYTEHLSYCGDDGYLYDLLPIPMTEEAVHYVAARIRQTQDILGQQIAVENASYYVASPVSEMTEPDFINAVLKEANCLLHLDINNVYVNSVNFGFDPHAYLRKMLGERIVYAHVAGHYQEAPNLIIDTHGAEVIDPVWALLDYAYQLFGAFPTLLERDLDIPPLSELMREVAKIAELQQPYRETNFANEWVAN